MRSPRAMGSVGGDVSGFLSNLVGGFASAEQAQGAMSQAQLDAMNAVQQQQSRTVMTLVLVGLGAFLVLKR